jgi:F-box and leucine-rich repeat protein GRR1
MAIYGIHKLPSELLFSIFMLLTASDLLTCMLVSKSWAQHAVSILWRKPVINTTDALKTLGTYLSEEKSTFLYSSFIRSFDVPKAIRGSLSDEDVLPFAECHYILSLGLAGPSLSEDAVVNILLNNSRIKSIDISGVSRMTDQGIDEIVSTCQCLEDIDISCCQALTDISIMGLTTYPKLKSVSVLSLIAIRLPLLI